MDLEEEGRVAEGWMRLAEERCRWEVVTKMDLEEE